MNHTYPCSYLPTYVDQDIYLPFDLQILTLLPALSGNTQGPYFVHREDPFHLIACMHMVTQ